jgi:CRISPR system Cascade subunit CasB
VSAAVSTQPSTHARDFVAYLEALAEKDRGALAALRRSLGFRPGGYPAAFPFVERFVGHDRHAEDPLRKALYLVAGLYALHPAHRDNESFAAAFGQLRVQRGSESIEKRFIALLSSDPENMPNYLRQAVSLLAAEGLAFDYAALLTDLSRWLNPFAQEQRDALRQRWARDFYRALVPREPETATVPPPNTATQ